MQTKLRFDATKRQLERKNIQTVIKLFVAQPLKELAICNALFALAVKNKRIFYKFLYANQRNKLILQEIKIITETAVKVSTTQTRKFINNALKYQKMLNLTANRSIDDNNKTELTTTTTKTKRGKQISNNKDIYSNMPNAKQSELLLQLKLNIVLYERIKIRQIYKKNKYILTEVKHVVNALKYKDKNKYTFDGLCKLLKQQECFFKSMSIQTIGNKIQLLASMYPEYIQILKTVSIRPMAIVNIVRHERKVVALKLAYELNEVKPMRISLVENRFCELRFKQQLVMIIASIFIDITGEKFILYDTLMRLHVYFGDKYNIPIITEKQLYDRIILDLCRQGMIKMLKLPTNYYSLTPYCKLQILMDFESISTAVWFIKLNIQRFYPFTIR